MRMNTPASGTAVPLAPARVLVVDDEEATRLLCCHLLQDAGFSVSTASSGVEALQRMAEVDPAVLILDYMMPDLDGVAVTQSVRAGAQKDVTVLMLTASGVDQHIHAAFDAGADDYIMKPIRPRILLERVRGAVHERAQRRSAQQHQLFQQAHTALLEDLEEARRVQRAMIPALPTQLGAFAVHGTVVSCQQVGGDVVALLKDAQGIPTVCMVDVSGHGVAAALVASSVVAELRLALAGGAGLAQAFAEVNRRLGDGGVSKYACVAAARLRGRQVDMVNAGLPPLHLVRDGVALHAVSASGTPLGLWPGAEYEETTWELHPRDRLVMMSDGLTEPFGAADDGEMCLRVLNLLLPGQPVDLEGQITTLLKTIPLTHPDDASLVVLDVTAPEEHGAHPGGPRAGR